MKRLVPFAVCFAALLSRAGALPPASPDEMAAATERWMVEGAGARFPDGMASPASDGAFVIVDGTWPLPFRDRVGEAVALRVSPETGCYEFVDPDGTVFWTVVPVAPLTWNWISPFRSPLRQSRRRKRTNHWKGCRMRKSIVRLFFRFMLCFLVWTAATVFFVMDWTLGNLPRGPGFDTRTDEAILKYLVFLPRHGSHPIGFWFNGLVWALGLSVLYGAVRAALRMVRRWIVRERRRVTQFME